MHPTDAEPKHELYLMCDDIEATVADPEQRGIEIDGGVSDEGWGRLATTRLPGGGPLGIYEPRHPVATSTEA